MKSHCPINYSLEHVGDRWSLLILRDLIFKGKRHYNEFLEGGESISTSVLGDRLKHLEQVGLIWKGQDSVKRSRIRYSLTRKGIDLVPLLIEMILWSARYDTKTNATKDFVNEAQSDKEELVQKTISQLLKDHQLEDA